MTTLIQGEDREISFGIKDVNEDIYIDLTGNTEISCKLAATLGGFVEFKKSDYSDGTISQSGNTITGVGTTFTAGMVGGTIMFSDGISAGTISAFVSATELTVTVSQTKSSSAYYISYLATHEIVVTDPTKGKFKVVMSDTKSALIKLGDRDVEVTVDWGTTRRIVQAFKAITVVKRLF